MISTEMRRDLDEPLRHFQNLDIVHLYRSTPMNDLVPEDFGEHLIKYSSPRQLISTLRRLEPDVVQMLEPFALINLPYLAALRWYFRTTNVGLVTVTLENVPLATKYTMLGESVFRWMVRPLLSRASVVYYLNDGARQNLLDCGADPERLYREMYGCWGVDTEEFSPSGPARTLSTSSDELVFLFIGRLVEAKGIFDILHAFDRIRDRLLQPARLVFIGDGADRKKLENEIARRGLGDSVNLMGTIKNRELPEYIRGADIFVLAPRATSQWAEQVGMVFIQAMSCGIPVIGTTSGSIPEFVPRHEAGFLVSENDVDELAAAMETLAGDAQMRRKLGRQARAIVESRYDARQNIRRIDQFLLDRFQPNGAES
jgi:glycosyltransferase involved in cell wall biosynthesis